MPGSTDTPTDVNATELSTAVFAGVGGMMVVLIVILLVIFLVRRKSRHEKNR